MNGAGADAPPLADLDLFAAPDHVDGVNNSSVGTEAAVDNVASAVDLSLIHISEPTRPY